MAELNPTMLDPDEDNLDYEEVPEDYNKEEGNQSDQPTRSEEEQDDSSDVEETVKEVTEDPSDLSEGTIIKGTISKTEDTLAWVELRAQADGILPYDKLKEGGISEGEEVLVKIIEEDYEDGAPLLSEKQARADRAWQQVRKFASSGKSIEGQVFKKIKGGFLVNILDDLTAFMPMSHISLSKKDNYDRFIDESFDMKILEHDRDEDNVVVSRRKHLEEQKSREKERFYSENEVGDWIKGTVKNIVNFGAFINLGPVDGLLHVSDISWGNVGDPEDQLTKGEEIEVKILSINRDDDKIALGLKQKYPDPWEDIEDKYEVGQVTTGEIAAIDDNAVYVRLEENVQGRIDESELAWTQTWDHPSDSFDEGEKIEFKILNIDNDERTIELSRKQTRKNPWNILKEKFPEGTVLEAPIVDIHKDHLTVQLLKEVKGIVKKDNISWDDDDVDLYETFSIGQKIKCKVLKMNPDDHLVELGVKQTTPDPWVQKAREYPEGTTLNGTVTSVLQFGAFVEIEDDLEGLVHVSEMTDKKRVNPHEIVEEGEEVGVKVLSIDEDERKIDLSIQAYEDEQRRKEMEEYMDDESSEEQEDMTMGDIVGDDLENLMKD